MFPYCYVGITRAMEKLYITHAESRRLHGSDTFNPPSRFIKEIPKDLINEIRPRAQTHIPYNRKDFKETKLESTNLNTGVQYRYNNNEWLLSIDGDYPVGTWRVELPG